MSDLDFNKYIGARIRKKRKQMGISLQQLADLLKLSCQQVQKYESGASKISADRLALVSHIFNEPVDYFYRDINFDNITIGDAEKPTVISHARQHHLNILLVEDNPGDAIIFRETAENIPSVEKVTIEHHANNVMPFLLNHQQNPSHKLPDVIFLDLGLSSGSGFEVLKKVKEDQSLRHLPIIVLSGSVNWEDMVRSYRLGAASYILKSSPDRTTMEILKQAVEYWGQCAILPTE